MDRAEAIVKQSLPPGFLFTWAGESRDLRESGDEVFFVLILALIIVYMVLAAQFESIVHPFTVILAVPLAAFGAFGALWLLSFLSKTGLMPPLPAISSGSTPSAFFSSAAARVARGR